MLSHFSNVQVMYKHMVGPYKLRLLQTKMRGYIQTYTWPFTPGNQHAVHTEMTISVLPSVKTAQDIVKHIPKVHLVPHHLNIHTHNPRVQKPPPLTPPPLLRGAHGHGFGPLPIRV
jgi:hypothetical protein